MFWEILQYYDIYRYILFIVNKISYWNFILARPFKVNIFLVLGILNSLLYGLYFGILHIIYSETIKVLYKLRKILKTVGDSSSLIWHFTMNFLKRNDKLLLIPSCWVRFIITRNQAYLSLESSYFYRN